MTVTSEFRTFFWMMMSAALVAACGAPDPSGTVQPRGVEAETGNLSSSQSVSVKAEDASTDTRTAFASLPPPYNSADYSLGRRTFKLCSACHTAVEGGQNLVGPNLHGVFDRKAGSLEGFRYSRALQAADFDWTPERVETWLSDPNGYLPGNNMSFAGVRKPADRQAVIAYLMSVSGYEEGQSDNSSAIAPD